MDLADCKSLRVELRAVESGLPKGFVVAFCARLISTDESIGAWKRKDQGLTRIAL
jgi:hypothetical protein